MKTIKKIQPKANIDIDLDVLTQKIKANKETQNEVWAIETAAVDNTPSVKKAVVQKTIAATPPKVLKKAGRKKTNTEAMHRFAIDLPEWLFEQIRQEATDNFSTVRGQILKLLFSHYKA